MKNASRKIRALVDAGAASYIALGNVLLPEELKKNLFPEEWLQKSVIFTTNAFFLLKFIFP